MPYAPYKHWFVDTTLATGANDGTSVVNAWQNLVTAISYNGFDPNSINLIWIRRLSSHIMTATVHLLDDGFADKPIIYLSWPRNSNSNFTGGTWTNGSNVVSNITGVSLVRSSHQGRYVTAPNGFKYLITRVIDSTTMNIDRLYAGSTVTGVSGVFTIHADEWFDSRVNEGVVAGWDNDNNSLPLIDYNLTPSIYITASVDSYYNFIGIEFLNYDYVNGPLYTNVNSSMLLQGCLMKSSANNNLFSIANTRTYVDRSIFEGSGVGDSQKGLYLNGSCKFSNVAIYNCGDIGMQVNNNNVIFENVNVGIEIPNGDYDVFTQYGIVLDCSDLNLGGTNGYVLNYRYTDKGSFCNVENYQKVLRQNKTWFTGGEYETVAISGEFPNKKLSDTVTKLYPNDPLSQRQFIKQLRYRLPLGTINMEPGLQTVPFYIFNNLEQTLNFNDPELNIYIEAKYVDSYIDDTKYTKTIANSTKQDILPAGVFINDIIVDGSMELDSSSWIDHSTPTIHERSSEQSHIATYSRKVVVNGANQGLHQNISNPNYENDLVRFSGFVYGDGVNELAISLNTPPLLVTIPSVIYPVGWTPFEAYFTGTATTTCSIYTESVGSAGTWYFDNFKIETLNRGADDWTEIPVIVNPAVQSLVEFNLVLSVYDDTNAIFIDPQIGTIT